MFRKSICRLVANKNLILANNSYNHVKAKFNSSFNKYAGI